MVRQAAAEEPLPAKFPTVAPDFDGRQMVSMTLRDVLAFAETQHPLLAVRDSEVQQAEAGLVAAATRDNPQFVLDTDTPTNISAPTEISMRLMFPFHTAGKLAKRSAAAVAEIRRASLARNVDRTVILLESVDATSEVLYRQTELSVLQELHELAQKRAELIPEGFQLQQAGITLSDKIDAEQAASKLRLQYLEAERQLTVARQRLAQAIGAPAQWRIKVRGDLQAADKALLPLDNILFLAEQQNPELHAALAAVDVSHRQLEQAIADGVPDVELGPLYQDELRSDGGDRVGARINFDVPLFDRNQGEVARTSALIQTNEQLVRVAAHKARSEVAAMYFELQRAQESAKQYGADAAQLTVRYEKILNDPDVTRLLRKDQVIGIQEQLLNQQLNILELQYRCYWLYHRLQVLAGQPVVLPGEVLPPLKPIEEEETLAPVEIRDPAEEAFP
jgi:cobalt-zinc-cadmium efflux system outer membrane protein